MRTRRRATVSELREAIECLPRHTRVAMLAAIAANRIIVGVGQAGDPVENERLATLGAGHIV
jgi:hypothetical protein